MIIKMQIYIIYNLFLKNQNQSILNIRTLLKNIVIKIIKIFLFFY